MSDTLAAVAQRNGQGVGIVAPATITSIHDGNDEYTIAINSLPAGGTFRLLAGVQATSPITVSSSLPTGYGLWQFPTVAGHQYKLATGVQAVGATQALHRVFDGANASGTLLATVTVNETSPTADFTNSGTNDQGGTPIPWHTIATVTATGTTLSLLITGVANQSNNIPFDCLYVKDMTIGGTPVIYDNADATVASHGTNGFGLSGNSYYQGAAWYVVPNGNAMICTVDPAAVQTAFRALSNVGSGNATVTSADGGTTLTLTYVGSLAGAPGPVVTASDVAVGVTHTYIGGNVPTITTARLGSPLVCSNKWMWSASRNPASPKAYYPFPQGGGSPFAVQPGDVVTLTWPSGWISDSNGPIPAGSCLVENRSNKDGIVDFVPGASRSTLVGWNMEGENITETIFRHSDLATRLQGPFGLTYDSNHYPLTSQGASISATLANQSNVRALPPGPYTFLWDGNLTDITIGFSGFTTVTELTQYRITGQVTGNRRVFNLQLQQPNISPAPILTFNFTSLGSPNGSGVYPHNIQNFHLYPPDPADATNSTPWGTDPANPPPFAHPHFAYMTAGMRVARGMDAESINGSANSVVGDFVPSTRLGQFSVHRRVTAPISDIRAYTGTDVAFDPTVQPVVIVTTSTPHGLPDLAYFTVDHPGTIQLSDSTTCPVTYIGLVARVLSPTTFTTQINYTGGGITMTNILGGQGGTIGFTTGGAYEDFLLLCATITSLTDIHLNTPFLATQALVAWMAQRAAAILPPGIIIHLECANEVWNGALGFFQYYSASALTRILGYTGGYPPGYVARSSQHHAWFKAAWIAAGRSAGTFKTVYGTQQDLPGQSLQPICQAIITQGVAAPDEVCTAPYIDGNYEPLLAPMQSNLTTDQQIDIYSLRMEYDGFLEGCLTRNYATLQSFNFNQTRMIGYEGGPSVCYLQPLSGNTDPINHAVAWHPRMYHWWLRYYQRLNDLGMGMFSRFFLASQITTNVWAAYWYYDQLRGTGDATVDTVNVSNPDAFQGVTSQEGGAAHYWNSLLGSVVVPTDPDHVRRRAPGRNRGFATYGYPRGLRR